MRKTTKKDTLSLVTEAILGKPCYLVQQGHGSFLTLNFGQPKLSIREPIKSNAKSTASERIKKHLALRTVNVYGKYHLWIYMCDWLIEHQNRAIAHSESSRNRISEALKIVDGQKLTKISIEAATGDTTFILDLGSVLKTKKFQKAVRDEQWILFMPNNQTMTVRSDGKYAIGNGNSKPSAEKWSPI